MACCASSAFSGEPPLTAIAFSTDGGSVIVGAQGTLAVYSWPEQRLLEHVSSTMDNIHDLAFSANGRWLAVAGGTPAEFGKLEVFSWPARQLSFALAPHDDMIYAVSWNTDGSRIATASHDRRIGVHDVELRQTVRRMAGHSRGVKAIAFLDHDDRLVSAGIDQNLRLWDVESGRSQRTLNNHTEQVHDLAVRPASEGSLPMVVSVSDDRSIRLWQPTIGRMMRFARLDRGVPLAVAWTPDGRYIVASCSDGRVRVVDPDTAEFVDDLPGMDGWVYSLAVHPNGRELAIGGERGRLARVVLP